MLGENLVKLRKSKRLRQDEVADKIDVARTTYAMYEQNRRQPDYETLKKLAIFFNVSTDYLLDLRNIDEGNIDLKDLLEHGKITYGGVELNKEQCKACGAFIKIILDMKNEKEK